MATKKSTRAKKADVKNSDPLAATKTEVPSVIVSDEFHAPIAENSSVVNNSNRRLVRYIVMTLGLIIIATLFVWLSHDRPVG